MEHVLDVKKLVNELTLEEKQVFAPVQISGIPKPLTA